LKAQANWRQQRRSIGIDCESRTRRRVTCQNDGHASIRGRLGRQHIRVFQLVGSSDDNRQFATVSRSVQAKPKRGVQRSGSKDFCVLLCDRSDP
jgi:hypothetical protein